MITLQRSRLLTTLLILTVLSSIALRTFPASAQPNYSPGVKPGDSITYGEFSINGTTPYPPFPPNTTSLKLTVQTVNSQTNNVNASLVYIFKNGTQSTQNLFGNTVTGQGNLFPFLTAGNLTAGDLFFNSPYPYYFPYVINATVERVYAGALRSVNLFNLTFTSYGQTGHALFYWDVRTGLLLDAAETVSQSFVTNSSFSLHFRATETNVWTPDTSPDYSFDASSLSSAVIRRGESTGFRLDLTSLNSFTGSVTLSFSTPTNSTIQPPTIMLNPTSVSVPADGTANAVMTVSANATTTLGQIVISLDATSGTINHQAKLLVVLAPPDFIVNANPANLTIPQGTSKNSTLTITGRGGFTGTVTLQLQTPPPFGTFVAATLSQTAVPLNSTVTSATSTLTVSAVNYQPGTTSIYITANSGSIYQTVYIPVNVTGPDFRMTANPGSLSLKQGQTGQSVITLTSVLGFTGLVNLSTNPYGGISSSLSDTVLDVPAGGQANATLTISISYASPGYYYVYVTGTSATGLVRSAYVAVNVTGPDFTFTSSGSFFALESGQSVNSTLTLSSVEGFSGSITLTVSTYGPVTGVVSPSILTLNSNQTATAILRITVLPTSPSTSAQVDVRATSGSIVHDVYVQISVTGPDFNIITDPSFLSIPQGGSGRATVSLSSIDNFAGDVTLSASSFLPATFSINPVRLPAGGSATTTLTIQVPLNTAAGYYYVGIEGSSGALVRYSSVEVYVIGPDFSLTASPSFLSIPEGGNATSTLYVSSLDNLQGMVNISVGISGPFVASLANATLSISPNSTVTTTIEFSVGLDLAPGYYDAVVTASLGSISHSSFITIRVTGPDFSIYSLPGSLALERGATGVSTVYLTSLEGFSGNVSLAVLSNGLNAAATDSTVALSAGGSSSTTIIIQAPGAALPGSYYYVAVEASSGNIHHGIQISVQVIAPDFTIFSNPAQLSIQSGGSAQSTIQLTSLNGFNGTVALSTFGPGSGNFSSPIMAVLSASNVTLNSGGFASVVLNITTTPAAAGEVFSVQVTATSDGLVHSTSVYVTVTGPSFMISPSTGFLTVPQGGSSSLNITTSSVNGFSGNVSLTVGFSFGIYGALTPQNITLTPGGSVLSILNVTAPSTTVPGFYWVYITGTSGTMIRSTFIQVQVTGVALSLTANPTFMILNPGSSGNSTITLNGFGGFSGTISLSASSVPAGLTTNLSPTSVMLNPNSTSATSRLTIIVPNGTASGLYYVEITATSNSFAENITIFVQVIGTDFNLFAYPSSLTLSQGGSASTTLIISGIGGFTGLVNFTAYSLGYAPGLEESFSPLNVTLSQSSPNATLTMTVSASLDTPAGSYNVTVVGVSYSGGGFATHTVTVEVTVLARPDFTIATTPVFINIVQGTTGSFTISLTSNNGFSGIVSLTALLTPPGPNADFSNSTVFIGEGSNAVSTLTIIAGGSPVGFYNVTIEAVAGSLSHQVVVNIYIAPKPDFSLATSSTGLIIVSGASDTSTVSVSPMNGFVAPVSLSATGPAGFTTSYSINPIMGGSGTSTLTVTVDSSVATGSYIVTVTGTSGLIAHSATINVTVSSSTKTNLVVSQVSWNHRLSLSKNGNTQTFTLILKNTGKSMLYVQLLAAGNSTDLKSFFNLKSGVASLSPGSSLMISLSQPFDTTSIGSKYSFTLQVFYGTSIDSSGNILSPQTLQVVKGAFTIVS